MRAGGAQLIRLPSDQLATLIVAYDRVRDAERRRVREGAHPQPEQQSVDAPSRDHGELRLVQRG